MLQKLKVLLHPQEWLKVLQGSSNSLEDIVTLKDGEIMVAPTTNPSWAPVFTKIKAAVTDIGGLTSHAAIVSREYGLPSVTGTGVATSVIKTGDIIKVDGTTGIVTIVKRAKGK